MKKIAILIFLFQSIMTNDISAQSQTTVQKIVKEFRTDPLEFKKNNLDKYILTLSNQEIDELIPALYEGLSGIKEKSEAADRIMGRLNKRYNRSHGKYFNKKIRNDSRRDYKMVLIEGDSWFNFPTPLKSDLTKILIKKADLLVYSSAFGGDWISRMIKDQSYAEEIKRLGPDAFILSGGGNDIVGERLSSFVDLPSKNLKVNRKFKVKEKLDSTAKTGGTDFTYIFSYGREPEPEVIYGTQFLNTDFFKMLVELELQYKIIHQQVNNQAKNENGELKQMKIITQGYDYPIPRIKKAKLFCNPWRAILNRFLGSGKWLYMPLKVKGIDDPEDQRKTMKAMMYYFNEMLINIAEKKDSTGKPVYPHAYHVDSRGLLAMLGGVEPARYWFDELHPKKLPYDIISDVILTIIQRTTTDGEIKVIKTVDTVPTSPRYSDRLKKRNEKKNKCKCFKTH